VSIYVKRDGEFEQADAIVRDCPHCGAHAALVIAAPPSFEHLSRTRPRHAGIVFECTACKEPRFARVAVRSFGADAIELSSNLVEVERAREKFSYSYLPDRLRPAFAEALECYTADLFLAFGIMCRRIVQAAIADTRHNGGPQLTDLFTEAVQIAEIDADTSLKLQTLLFDIGVDDPVLNAMSAAILIEIVKDMFYECYVRRAKLKAAVQMRRYFAGETTQKVTPIGSLTRQATSG
jgi:hypothetical protein